MQPCFGWERNLRPLLEGSEIFAFCQFDVRDPKMALVEEEIEEFDGI